MADNLVKGDLIKVKRLFYWHYGIYIDNDHVIHYSCSPYHWWQVNATVKFTTLNEFIGKKRKRKIYYRGKQYNERITIVQRAMSRLGETQYSLFFNNCKHLVDYCKQ